MKTSRRGRHTIEKISISGFLQKLAANNSSLGECLGKNYVNHFRTLFSKYERKELKKLKILDTGCYTGSFLEHFVRENECYGVDISEEALEIARKKGIKVYVVDLEIDDLPFPDDFFDVVVSTHTLEHIVNVDHYLQEIYRVLKDKEVAFFVVPNTNTIIGNLFRIFFDLPSINEARYKSYMSKIGH